jgi:hypothetical protein
MEKELYQGRVLNHWIMHLSHWCPAQLYYYFVDNDGGQWCIYLRWRQDPWTAELVRCDRNWDFLWDGPSTVNLLVEKVHTPGTITGYFLEEEYPFLMNQVLEMMKVRFPDLDFPNNQ